MCAVIQSARSRIRTLPHISTQQMLEFRTVFVTLEQYVDLEISNEKTSRSYDLQREIASRELVVRHVADVALKFLFLWSRFRSPTLRWIKSPDESCVRGRVIQTRGRMTWQLVLSSIHSGGRWKWSHQLCESIQACYFGGTDTGQNQTERESK